MTAKLYLVSGKIASGKSTLIRQLAEDRKAILISQDDWMSTLFPSEIHSLEDYVKYSTRLASAMGPHVTSLLKLGAPVALDFPANTLQLRSWMKSLAEKANCKAELHFLNASDSICLKRLTIRNASGQHRCTTTEEQFHQFTKYVVPPTSAEGLDIVEHT